MLQYQRYETSQNDVIKTSSLVDATKMPMIHKTNLRSSSLLQFHIKSILQIYKYFQYRRLAALRNKNISIDRINVVKIKYLLD